MMLDALSRPVHVALARTVAPTVEPIGLDEARLWLHVDDTSENSLVDALILAARQKVEDDTGLALLTQTWTLSVDRLPSPGIFVLPVGPVQSVSSVVSYDVNNAASTVATTVYRADTTSLPARLVLKDGQSWPTTGRPQDQFLITFVAGYGADPEDVPMPLRQAMHLLIAHWFANRSTVVTGAVATSPVPMTYEALIAPYRLRELL